MTVTIPATTITTAKSCRNVMLCIQQQQQWGCEPGSNETSCFVRQDYRVLFLVPNTEVEPPALCSHLAQRRSSEALAGWAQGNLLRVESIGPFVPGELRWQKPGADFA